ncbi:MAG: NAD(P)-dependent oxidoreductase [Deltaproteobacteria bacterium]|nr:NAD(P)-dependent oxidoreductase [Deltaproteobacteria bacterium]
MINSSIKDCKICIIGGTGFIGKHLISELQNEAYNDVRILTRDGKNSTFLQSPFQITQGDLLDPDSLNRFITPDSTVINLAYLSGNSLNLNLKATENIVDACIAKRAARLIHCSTAVVAGRAKDNVINENTACIPATQYEKSKLEIENILNKRLKGKSELIILRPTAVFGRHGKNLIKVANDLLSLPPFTTFLKTALFYKRRLNLVCVENVVSAILFLMQINDRMDGKRFIISDDDERENNYYDIINLLAKYFGHKPVKAFYMPYRYHILRMLLIVSKRSNTDAHRNYSSNKLFCLGFKKSIQFREGIRRFASWYNKSLLYNWL